MFNACSFGFDDGDIHLCAVLFMVVSPMAWDFIYTDTLHHDMFTGHFRIAFLPFHLPFSRYLSLSSSVHFGVSFQLRRIYSFFLSLSLCLIFPLSLFFALLTLALCSSLSLVLALNLPLSHSPPCPSNFYLFLFFSLSLAPRLPRSPRSLRHGTQQIVTSTTYFIVMACLMAWNTMPVYLYLD